MLEDLSTRYPHDPLALQVGHQIDFFTGDSRMLRDRIARALPALERGMPGYHAVLGMHAFGLEETGDYARAERGPAQRRARAARRLGLARGGARAWRCATRRATASPGSSRTRAHWTRRQLLRRAQLVAPGAVPPRARPASTRCWRCYDERDRRHRLAVVLDMIDASALLWRLQLRGVDVGDAGEALAERWAPIAGAGNYAFNDLHAMMAFVGAGRMRDAATRCSTRSSAALAARRRQRAASLRDVGHAATQAIQAFGAGRLRRRPCELLRPVRSDAHRFGGSHAQRDLLDLTLIEAALRGGDPALGAALARERAALRPASPLACRLVQRATGHQRPLRCACRRRAGPGSLIPRTGDPDATRTYQPEPNPPFDRHHRRSRRAR